MIFYKKSKFDRLNSEIKLLLPQMTKTIKTRQFSYTYTQLKTMEGWILTNSNKTTISIPEHLAEKIKKRAEEKGFKSLSEYVTYILRQVQSKIEADEKQKSESSAQGDNDIKQNLRDMGYLD